MSQNTSSAVMAQRREPHDSLDDFPTPPWSTRALMRHIVLPRLFDPRFEEDGVVWEPACNRGFMARPLGEYFARVIATDVHDYGWPGQERVVDFLYPGEPRPDDLAWIITNPPFRLAAEFVARARALDPAWGYAVLVRTAFLEGGERWRTLFEPHPPSIVAQFVERVPMVKGRCDPKASTATSYCWLVWMRDHHGRPEFTWIPPCRRALERPGDYPADAAEGDPADAPA